MGDFVGVDPQLLRQLADRLHDLAGVLAKDGQAIVSAMQNQDHRLDLSVFGQVSTQSGEDSRTMAKRADLAMELQNQTISGSGLNADTVFAPLATQPPNFVSLISDPDMIEVPFDTTDQQYVSEATADANKLRSLLTAPNSLGDPNNVAIVSQLGQTLNDHQDDPLYLNAFYQNGGAQTIYDMASDLRVNGMVADPNDTAHPNLAVLNDQGKQLLAPFANSFAENAGRVTMPPPDGVFAAASGQGDPRTWSFVQLFANGPSGDVWDPAYLKQYGTTALAYDDRNLNGAPGASGRTDMPFSVIIMQRIGESIPASIKMLNGPDGADTMKLFLKDQHGLGLDAKSDGSGVGVPAIIANIGFDRPQDPQAAADAFNNRALAQAAGSFVQDLAASAGATAPRVKDGSSEPGYPNNIVQPNPESPGWPVVTTTRSSLKALMADIGADGKAADYFQNAIAARALQSVTGRGRDNIPDAQADMYNLGALNGWLKLEQQAPSVKSAQNHDLASASDLQWTQMALGGFGNTAMPWGLLGIGMDNPSIAKRIFTSGPNVGQIVAGGWSPFLTADSTAADADAKAQVVMQGGQSSLDVPIVQALISEGALPTPDASQTWYVDGVVSPTVDNVGKFALWLQAQSGASMPGSQVSKNPTDPQVFQLTTMAQQGFLNITPHWDFNQS
jgi:hypothetical protein